MSDDISLRIMCVFEAGARMHCSSELVSLAALLYHKFFKARTDMGQHEQFTFAAACLSLAHKFYETPFKMGQVVSVTASVAHGAQHVLDTKIKEKLVQSVLMAERVIVINLDFQLDYKANRRLTPGDLLRMRANRGAGDCEAPILLDDNSSDVSSYIEDDNEDEDYDDNVVDRLLRKNSNNTISAHRYLAHYLKSIQLLVEKDALDAYTRLSNVAWIFLTDFYWCSSTVQYQSNHLACACLMLAIEACRRELDCRPIVELANLWRLVNKKWHLILCDDLDQQLLKRIMMNIVNYYAEYERVLEHELNVFVIDPKSGERTFKTVKRGLYELPAGAQDLIGSNVRTTFSCEGLGYGYYADTDNACKIFHVCQSFKMSDGSIYNNHWSFMCGNQTVFNQVLLACSHPEDAIPCESSKDFYYINDYFGDLESPSVKDNDLNMAQDLITRAYGSRAPSTIA